MMQIESTKSECLPNGHREMNKLNKHEKEILAKYEAGALESTAPSKTTIAKFKSAALATVIKLKRRKKVP
jgi:hypothetical protein